MSAERKPMNLHRLRAMHAAGERIAMLTCYEASFARLIDEAGVDVMLVGDSLGMTVQGRDSTVPVSMDEMTYHTQCVARRTCGRYLDAACARTGAGRRCHAGCRTGTERAGPELTTALPIPVIGIGAGPGCSGQVLVLHDMLGITRGKVPRFVRNFLSEGGGAEAAVRRYVNAVKDGSFPAESIHTC